MNLIVGDTAFRFFLLLASRWLQSDRFLTVDLRLEFYSPLGLDWGSPERDDERPLWHGGLTRTV